MAEKTINIGGRLHSTATGNVVAWANEILDDSKNKKQSDINTETYTLVNEVKAKLDGLSPEQQGALDVATKANKNEANLGYYVCSTEENIAAKVISDATGYILSKGGSIKIKMTNANTANNATLNINSTGAKALYYDGERASANNSWEAGETVEVYYDGTSYYANNVAGGSGSGDCAFDISAKTGQNYETLNAALTAANSILSASKKKGGMSIKFIQTTPATYNVVKTEGVTELPTGTELDSASSIASGTYTASQLSDFSTLPTTSAVTYYIAVTEDETTTYTTWVITLAQSSDNKYVQYRLMATSFSTTPSDWQGVDDEPTAGSENLVKSGGVVHSLKEELYNYTIEEQYITTGGVILSNGQHLLIEVKEGDIIAVTASSAMTYQVLKTYNGLNDVQYSEATGYDTWHTINANGKKTFVIPSDANYMTLTYKAGGTATIGSVTKNRDNLFDSNVELLDAFKAQSVDVVKTVKNASYYTEPFRNFNFIVGKYIDGSGGVGNPAVFRKSSNYKYSSAIQVYKGDLVEVYALADDCVIASCDSSTSNLICRVLGTDRYIPKTYTYKVLEDGYITICGRKELINATIYRNYVFEEPPTPQPSEREIIDVLVGGGVPTDTTLTPYEVLSSTNPSITYACEYMAVKLPNGKNVLFDCSRDYKANCLLLNQHLVAHGITKIDYLIISHYHDDHVGALIHSDYGLDGSDSTRLWKNGESDTDTVTIDNVSYTKVDLHGAKLYLPPEIFVGETNEERQTGKINIRHTSSVEGASGLEKIIDAQTLILNDVTTYDFDVVRPTEGQAIDVDGLTLKFYNCDQEDYQYGESYANTAYNTFTMGCIIKYGNMKIDFAGDITATAERHEDGIFEPSDILIAPHHGWDNTYNGLEYAYINTVNPRCVISCNGIQQHPNTTSSNKGAKVEKITSPMQTWCEQNNVPNYMTNINGLIHIILSKDSYKLNGNYMKYTRNIYQGTDIASIVVPEMPNGQEYYSALLRTKVMFNGTSWVDADGVLRVGNTASRPTGISSGFRYYDTELNSGRGQALEWDGSSWNNV
jgi:beta-lactamase superfamily II metal-dependent hydrolase